MTMPQEQHHVFEYLYRDAANYKVYGQILLSGTVPEADWQKAFSRFEEDEYFVPEYIGLPSLQAELWAHSDGPTDDDLPWHSVHSVRLASQQDMDSLPVWGSSEKLLHNIHNALSCI
ncbi:hypothetical protein ACWWD9_12425 [Methylovorus sp. SPW-M1]